MPRGTPLTPAQLAYLAKLYAECGNATEVARRLKLEPSTVVRALSRLGEQRRAILQRQALAVGMIRGREQLDELRDGVWRLLRESIFITSPDPDAEPPADGETPPLAALGAIEPAGVQALGNTFSRMLTVATVLDRREEQRRQARLTRKKTRAEIAALERRAEEIPAMEVLKAKLSPWQVLELMRSLSDEQLAALRAATRPRDAAAPTSADPSSTTDPTPSAEG